MKPVIALDLDGTLVSCAPRHQRLMRHVCGGDALDEDFIPRYWAAKREGASNVSALRALGHPSPHARAEAWARDIETWPWLGYDRLLPTVAESLTARRVRAVVLTARRCRAMVHQQVQRLGLLHLVDDLIVVSPHDAARCKATELGRLRAQGFIGDAETDADAAAAAGVPFAALAGGMRSAAFWQRRGQPSYPDFAAALAALPS
ncbi:HAD family hydrolase [Roseateles sp. BYS87W]|uniref:HAD family hydrolase n=1 Tax=Pelomonas baiyunensis TaxID=3299026 RepID=A0ABW7GXA8_9BURK